MTVSVHSPSNQETTKPEGVLAAENRTARQERIVSGLVQAHDSLKAT